MASVRQLRKEKGWSQQELATRAGVGIQTIIKLEKGKPILSVVKQAVCKALGTDDVEIVVYNPNRVQSTQNSK